MEITVKKYIQYLMIATLITLTTGCGDVPVSVDENTYEPKIVVDGIIMPGHRVENIRITRNFALNRDIDFTDFLITDATVGITDLGSGDEYPLSYNALTGAYESDDDNLIIEYGKQYQLSVQATVDGKNLSTTTVTTVPRDGFSIREADSKLTPLTYRERDESGSLKLFTLAFDRSIDTDSYIASIVALDASKESFVIDNPFEIEVEDLDEDNLFGLLQHQSQWMQTQTGGDNLSKLEILWFTLWFYGRYRIILYAADENLKDYFLTHKNIQDIDGNLWEPKFHFEGDGIGVFGAALTDTVFVEVLKE
ncbi:DUF4249 family protein [candidate division KSB1 bacterium]|nr:DUF4249 family protein [candidate division KSB1 bacterium]